MSVLVTGVAGFLGSHVAESLLARGHQVIGVDDLSGGFAENVPRGVKFYAGSILDDSVLKEIFGRHKVEYVYHLAAYAAEALSHFIRSFNYTNNVVGSANLINCAIKADAKCFVFTSSIAVYGAGAECWREDVTPAPEDPYGIAKYAVELDLRCAHRTHGLNYVIFRPHNVYGERQSLSDPYRNVVGIFMRQLLEGRAMTIFGDGRQTRAFSYVADVAPIMASAIDIPAACNQTFNIGSDEPATLNDLATLVAQALGLPRRVIHLRPRREARNAISDHSMLAEVFDYRPRWTLSEGLKHMARWSRRLALHRPLRPFEHIELDKNLPAAWKLSPERLRAGPAGPGTRQGAGDSGPLSPGEIRLSSRSQRRKPHAAVPE